MIKEIQGFRKGGEDNNIIDLMFLYCYTLDILVK